MNAVLIWSLEVVIDYAIFNYFLYTIYINIIPILRCVYLSFLTASRPRKLEAKQTYSFQYGLWHLEKLTEAYSRLPPQTHRSVIFLSLFVPAGETLPSCLPHRTLGRVRPLSAAAVARGNRRSWPAPDIPHLRRIPSTGASVTRNVPSIGAVGAAPVVSLCRISLLHVSFVSCRGWLWLPDWCGGTGWLWGEFDLRFAAAIV
jgi:hypothetical protein